MTMVRLRQTWSAKLPKLLLRRVSGDSMQPILRSGQLVLAGGSRRLQAGQVVIVRHNGIEKIKRIQQLEPDRLYVVGDNLSASTDSRHFGWLPRASVRGRVVWPRTML